MDIRNSYQLHYLSDFFYNKYDIQHYPEIEHKAKRPYIVLLIHIRNNKFALPFRSNIRHNNCYKFKHSSRPTESVTGIDFSKAVVVNNLDYIGTPAEIDNKEYVAVNDRIAFIIKKFTKYLDDYYLHVSGNGNKRLTERYKYTTLQYFHHELGIL